MENVDMFSIWSMYTKIIFFLTYNLNHKTVFEKIHSSCISYYDCPTTVESTTIADFRIVEDFTIKSFHDRAEVEFTGVTGVQRYRVTIRKNAPVSQISEVVRPAISNQFNDVTYQVSFENLTPGWFFILTMLFK